MKSVLRTGALVLFVLAFATSSFSQEATDPAQLYEQAKLDEKSGHPDEAIRKYEQIIKIDPTLAAAHNNLGRLLYQQGRLDEAIKPLRKAS